MNECPYCGADKEHWKRQPPAQAFSGQRLPFRPPGADKIVVALLALAGLAVWLLA